MLSRKLPVRKGQRGDELGFEWHVSKVRACYTGLLLPRQLDGQCWATLVVARPAHLLGVLLARDATAPH